jgi:zinc protease
MKMFQIRKANEVLEIRLRDILREELGSTYSVSVGYSSLSPYDGYETTRISFGCAPEKAASLKEVVMAEVDALKAHGITPEETAKVREQEIRSLEESVERNEYWLSSFLTLDLLRWDPERILARRERAENLTAEDMHRVFSENFPRDRFTAVTRLPERGPE